MKEDLLSHPPAATPGWTVLAGSAPCATLFFLVPRAQDSPTLLKTEIDGHKISGCRMGFFLFLYTQGKNSSSGPALLPCCSQMAMSGCLPKPLALILSPPSILL